MRGSGDLTIGKLMYPKRQVSAMYGLTYEQFYVPVFQQEEAVAPVVSF